MPVRDSIKPNHPLCLKLRYKRRHLSPRILTCRTIVGKSKGWSVEGDVEIVVELIFRWTFFYWFLLFSFFLFHFEGRARNYCGGISEDVEVSGCCRFRIGEKFH